MNSTFEFRTRSPDHFEALITPIVGRPYVRPVKTTAFDATVTARQLQRLALFTVRADSIHVNIVPSRSFTCLNIALGKPFTIIEQGRKQCFLKDIHVLKPDRRLILDARDNCRVLAACIYSKPLQDYILKLGAGNSPYEFSQTNCIENSNPASRGMVQGLASLWSALLQTSSSPGSDISVLELEDTVIASFLLASGATNEASRLHNRRASARAIRRAEEYLCAHLTSAVSRAELAAEACVSFSTLSRGFRARHGCGPMAFLKAHRLNAVYSELLGSELGSTTVTEVATRYGFNHLGKFSVEYKQAFQESPSTTLQH